jgi:hypothetical protein
VEVGIRDQNPDADNLTIKRLLVERVELMRKITLGGMIVCISTPEDVILQKLIWYRPKDQEDVLGVIAVNHDKLDEGYLRQWTDQLELTEVLANAWASEIESRQ